MSISFNYCVTFNSYAFSLTKVGRVWVSVKAMVPRVKVRVNFKGAK